MRRFLNTQAILVAIMAGCSSGNTPQRGHDIQGGQFAKRNLVSDGFIQAEHTDSKLVNSWGIAHLPTSPWWVADNATGVATIYDENGARVSPGEVTVGPTPTGIVANETTSFNGARFIVASEDGTISTWNGATTEVKVTNAGAVYKGLAISSSASRLYVTSFQAGKVEVYDANFNPTLSGSFIDPGIPAGFAPFGIRVVGDKVYVTYAMQDAAKKDDVPGAGQGYVDEFDTAGTFVRRVASNDKLNAPWGLALAPADFCQFPNQLLVGNFGDGRLIAFDLGAPGSGTYVGDNSGPFVIDGLWGLDFGNGQTAGPSSTLFFASGPQNETHGLFGRIDCAGGPGGGATPPTTCGGMDGGCPDSGMDGGGADSGMMDAGPGLPDVGGPSMPDAGAPGAPDGGTSTPQPPPP